MDSIWAILVSFIVFFIFKEQVSYVKKKRSLPGPSLAFPFVGNAISLVRNPTKFWEEQSAMAMSSDVGLSVNYILGKFIVFIRSTDLSHKVFANVCPEAFHLIVHPFGRKLLGERNLIYLMGQEHKDLRRRIAPNFSPKALSTYIGLKQQTILRHFKSWLEISESVSPESFPLRWPCRDMNLETSQNVFVGPYLSEESKKLFRIDYNLFNVALVSMPIDLPGCAFRNARLAVQRLVKTLEVCAEDSRRKMRSGEEPTCLVDFWMQETLGEIAALEAAGETQPPPFTSSHEIGGHLFDFLFAAQDASTSSLLWAVTLLEKHPEVLARVRKEVSQIWWPESNKLISPEQLREMRYTQAVAKEVVRMKVPTTLVPHVAGKDYPLTETYTIPKGALVFPSVNESLYQGFVEPFCFDPDRFMEDRQEDLVFKKNFLAFGAGTHQCVGQRYAINHLVLFIAMFTSFFDFKRDRTDGYDDIKYVPTSSPRDDCQVFLSLRLREFPSLS